MSTSADLATSIGTVQLRSPIMTASGTAGHGAELAAYGDLAELGAVVSKSLAVYPWSGNPAPRVSVAGEGMINAVGLAGPGVAAWRETYLPDLVATGATVVASIWGRTAREYEEAATALSGANVVAVEVNASCPNLEDRSSMFCHSPAATAELVEASKVAGVPRWVKLSLHSPNIVEVARSAVEAGAEALVIGNTLLGMVIDTETRRPVLGNGGGGVSGRGLLPIAVRAVFDVRASLPTVPLIGVGGVASGRDAVALIMAGADAVEVGTATFANPRAVWRVLRQVGRWMRQHGVTSIEEIKGSAHG